MSITLAHLRAANNLRLPLFKNSRGEPAHPTDDGSDWSLLEWCGAMSGEVGELCEAIDALPLAMRDVTIAHTQAIAKEMADVICYVDLVAMRSGITLDDHDFDRYPRVASLRTISSKLSASTGEVANIAKKIRRGDTTVEQQRERIAFLLADSLGYLGAVARLLGTEPMIVVRDKWNEVSERIDLDLRITEDGAVTGHAVRVRRGTRVIALLGEAGSGKSTIAQHLAEKYGARRYLFSDLLKTIAMRTLDFTREQCYGTQAQKEAIDPRYGFSPRTFLQKLGTEGIRNTLGRDFWIRATLAQIAMDAPELAVIEDTRFINEADAVRAAGGHVWYVLRPGERASTADQTHASEAEIARAYDKNVDDCIAPAAIGIPELRACVDALAQLRQLGA